MNNDNMKRQVLSGLFWKFSERIGAQLVTFVVSIVLARLLSPSDYGAISLITVFITIANVFVVSGFGNALIQKTDANSCDFSSVFYFNIVFSWSVYLLLYLASPLISDFYGIDVLCPALRVLALKVPLAGVNSVQQAYVSRHMIFKRFFFSTIIGTIVSAIVGITMAFTGYGIWALVGQYMTSAIMDTLVLWVTVKWRPTKEFSVKRLFSLLDFGWKILMTNLINECSNQLRSLIIGKRYKSEDLAFYTRGIQYPNLVITNVNSSIGSVLYPALAKLQNNKDELKHYLKKSMSFSVFIVSPMMVGLMLVAEDLIVLMLTDKWLECLPYLRLACIYLAFQPLTIANLQAINALGRSDICLKLEIIKRSSAIALILLAMPYGVFAIAATDLLVTLIAVILNAYPNRKLLNFSFQEQLLTIVPNMVRALLMGVILFVLAPVINQFIFNRFLRICIEFIIGAFLYIIICLVTRCPELLILVNKIKPILKRKL